MSMTIVDVPFLFVYYVIVIIINNNIIIVKICRKWTSEFDEVLDELQSHMEHECDVYFEKIKYCIIKVRSSWLD